jgi:Fe-S-cluster-containing hydrogenase component 2
MSLVETGCVTIEELKSFNLFPSDARFAKGPVAVVECIQEIPCNPCESACPRSAIKVGEPITALPIVDEDACSGCGICVAQCPGLAIFIVDKTYSETEAAVSFPYEYFPLPEAGDGVNAVSRAGERVCDARVLKVMNPKSYNRTPVVTVAVPKDLADDVRSIRIITASR